MRHARSHRLGYRRVNAAVSPCIRGLVYTHPRPAPAHARASSALGNKVGMPFDQREDFAAIDLSGLRVD